MDDFDKMFGVSNEDEPDEFDKMFGAVESVKSSAPTPASTDSDFIPGVQRGLQNLQASAYGATALAGSGLKKLGIESAGQAVQDFGMEGYNRNIEEAKQYPKKHSFKEVAFGKAGIGGAIDWAQGTLGELVPSMAEAAIGAGIGSVVAPGPGTVAGGLAGRTILKKGIDEAVKKAIKSGIGDLTEDQVRKQLTGQTLKKFGGKVGIAGSVMPLESGGMYAELLQEKGIDAPETALLFGALATSLEFAGGNSKLVDTFVDALSKGATGTVKKSAKELLTNIPQEALQEGGQELLSVLNIVANTDEKLLTADNVERIIESMAAGAIGGGAGAVVNAGFSAQAKDPGPGKTDAEIELDRRAANILNLKEDELGQSIQTLNDALKLNKEILDDPYKLDQKARELNVDPAELIRKTVEDNKNNQSLLDRINSGIQKKEELAKKEYEALSPEEKQAKEIENKLTEKRIADASQLNERITNIDNEITTLSEQYNSKFDPYALAAKTSPSAEERKVIEDKLITLNKRRNELLDKETPEVKKAFAPYTTRDGRQKYLEELFGTVNVGEKVGIEKDAAESAEVIESEIVPKSIADYANQIIANKSQERSALNEPAKSRTPEEEHNLRQIEDYVNYIKTYINNSFTPEERSIIENYWQGVKKELNLRQEEMTPGTEAFMRKKFFETQLANIEGNVKSDTATQSDAKQNVVPSLAEQNKRQAWFRQIAESLGDVPPVNRQAVETEIPRNLPGGLPSGFTNEQQVGVVPQFQVAEKQEALSKVNLEDIKKTFPNQTINQHEDGSVYVQFKNGKGVKINSIQNAGEGFIKLAIETGQMSKGQSILGITIGNEILLDENFADNKTLWHENKHVLDNLGLITEADDSALNKEFNKLRKAGKLEFALSTHENPKQRMVENRANMFAQIMVNREAYRSTAFGKVIQRVMDFFQQLFSFGRQTVSGLAREVESGKIYERQVNGQIVQVTVPQAEEVASKWYSALENAVAGFNQKQATPDQWKGMIKNFPGLKQDELDWVGVNDWLDKQEGKVSQADLLKFVQENNVQLEEVVKGEQDIVNKINEELKPLGYSYEEEYGDWSLLDENGELVEDEDIPNEVHSIINDVHNFDLNGETQHSTYQLPGGKNYKELLLTLPTKDNVIEQKIKEFKSLMTQKYNVIGMNIWDVMNEEETNHLANLDSQTKKADYKSNHWDEPNILAHIRFNERIDAYGNKVLFLEEIQSDWHQAGKKEGYQGNATSLFNSIKDFADKHNIKIRAEEGDYLPVREYKQLLDKIIEVKDINMGQILAEYHNDPKQSYGVPNAPFKNSTQWSLLAMKRMVRYAAENGFDKIAWTTGQQQFDRYAQGTEEEQAKRLHGMQEFYDKIIPNTFNAEFNKNKWGNAKVEQININPFESNEKNTNGMLWKNLPSPIIVNAIPITNRMKSKALREGMPMFEVREAPTQKISDDEYQQRYKDKNNIVRRIGKTLHMRASEVKQFIDKFGGSSYTRLLNVDKQLAMEYRNIDIKTAREITHALKAAHPLLEKIKLMSKEDQFIWNEATQSADKIKIEKLATKYNMINEWQEVRKVLDQIHKNAEDVGYKVGYIEEYWPRIIKDVAGFLQATKEISNQPEFSNLLDKEAAKIGLDKENFIRNYPERAADLISHKILNPGFGIGGPGNIQARKYDIVDKDLAQFYMDSNAALMSYIYSMTKKIEARKFFGKVPPRIAGLKADRSRKEARIRELELVAKNARDINPAEAAIANKTIDDLSGEIIQIEQILDEYKYQDRDYTENIGAYVTEKILSGELNQDHEHMVKEILHARFNEHGTTGLVTAFKNASYIDVLGSPLAAVTQIGDHAWAMYVAQVWTPKGLANYIKNAAKATSGQFKTTKKLFGGSEITKEDLYLDRIAQEFADGTTLSNAVSWVFRKVGLEKMDSIGKETLINVAHDRYKQMASSDAGRAKLMTQLKPIFGPSSESVINDLLSNNPSDNVKMLLYHKVLDFHPVALSSMPTPYLNGGNGRVAYMLKTYTIQQFDVFRREAWHNMKNGYMNAQENGYNESNKAQIIEGITNMVKLASLLVLANASADEIKDWMLGKETKFSDNVIENFLVLGGASRYIRTKVSQEGIGSGIASQLMPPFRFFNSATKDVGETYDNYIAGDTMNFNHARIIESIPGMGKLYYWHWGRGADYKKSGNEQEFSKVGKEVTLFKRQLENSEDKRTFLNSNLDGFKQMKLHENFQSALNRNQAVINKLKKIDQTTNVRERLGQLEMQREVILKRYFDVTDTMQ